jgi:hypothetical protein
VFYQLESVIDCVVLRHFQYHSVLHSFSRKSTAIFPKKPSASIKDEHASHGQDLPKKVEPLQPPPPPPPQQQKIKNKNEKEPLLSSDLVGSDFEYVSDFSY